MTLTVEPLRSRRDRQAFIQLPFRLYKDDPLWVAPLNRDMKEKLDPHRHPFFRHGSGQFFLAWKEGRCVGRVAALRDDAHNEFHGEKVVSFGLMEFERDESIARALMEQVATWGADQGMEILRGPLNYSANEECGMLVRGFDRSPALMMSYNPDWYVEIYEALGLKKARDLMAFYIDQTGAMDRLGRLAIRTIQRNQITLRPIDMKHFDQEQEILLEIYNEAWKNNWGFVPMGRAEFGWHGKKLQQVIIPKLTTMAFVKGEPAGFCVALPDFNQVLIGMKGCLFPFGLIHFLRRKGSIDMLRVVTMGVKSEFRILGVEGVLIHKLMEEGSAMGFFKAEISWVLEDNKRMKNLAANLGADLYKTYRIWEGPVKEFLP